MKIISLLMLAFNGLGITLEFVYASISKIAYFLTANWKFCKVLQLLVYSANNQLREKIHGKVFAQTNRKLFDENFNYECFFFIEECKIPSPKKQYRFCWQQRKTPETMGIHFKVGLRKFDIELNWHVLFFRCIWLCFR